MATLSFMLHAPSTVQAGIAAGYSEYFIPGFSDDLMAILDDIESTGIGTQLTSITTVSISTDGVTVYYDHWENGYGAGTTGADEIYTANKGDVLTFRSNTIPYPRGASLTACTGSIFPAGGVGGSANNCYDGRDRIYVAGGAVSVAQAFWPTTANTNYANSWEIYPLKPYQTSYVIPVGENLYSAGGSFADFLEVFVLVQATTDNTTIQINDPETGGVEVNVIRNRGETVRLDHIWSGTTVTANQPVQVQFIIGEDLVIPGQNNSRSYTAVPSNLWSTQYYSPVPGATGGWDTDIFIYNPTTSTLTINYEDRLGSGSFTVAANATESYQANVGRYVPTNSAVYLAAADGTTKFWAIGGVDAGSPTFNWGFTLIPPQTLTNEYFVSWAPGGWNQGTNSPQQANFSPVYVTPTQDNTTIFVDYSPTDGIVDATYTLNRIQMQRIFDSVAPGHAADADNTGMHIWATAPIAIMWGEDPGTSSQASPGLDAGYTILPLNQDWIDVVATLDKTANPAVIPSTAGQVSTFTLVLTATAFGLQDAVVVDTLPANWAYVTNTTTISLPNSIITGSAANPDIAGQNLTWNDFPVGPLDMNPNQVLIIQFQGITTGAPTPGYSINQASGTGTTGGDTFQTTDSATILLTQPTDVTVSKLASPTVVAAGGTLTYTLVYTNNGPVTATNVLITDTLPAQVTFGGVVSQPGSVTGPTGSGQTRVWTVGTLASGQTGSIVFTVTVGSPVSGTITNSAVITTTTPDSNPNNNNDDANVNVVNPAITIAKTPDLQQVASGGTVTFTIAVTNTGDITLTNVTVADPLAPNCVTTIGTLAPNASSTYTCTLNNVTLDFTNVATATGTPPTGPNVSDNDDAVVDVINPAIIIAKTPDNQQVASGSTVTFTITVTNTGDITLTNVTVADPLAPNCVATIGTLAPNASSTYTCTLNNVTLDFTNVA
ncbi:MAG: DUF11 domain-containing protein, partial [Chloroflexi bacterium]|nr:DUF11 domain-containing protein [Chloroflexota bacterium]